MFGHQIEQDPPFRFGSDVKTHDTTQDQEGTKGCITHIMRLSEKSRTVTKTLSKQIQNCLREQRKLTGFGFYRGGVGVKAPT